MSAKLQLTTKRNNQITIELLDNDFVQDYLVQLEKIKNNFAITQYVELPRLAQTPWNQVEITAFETRIKKAIQDLNAMHCDFPVDAAEVTLEPGQQGRNLLNQLHRHFTTGNRSVACNEPVKTWLDHSNLTFEIGASDRAEFSRLVHEINDVVHQAEKYYVSDREIKFGARYREYHILFDPSRPIGGATDLYSQYFVEFKPSHYEYFSNNADFDVWLPSGQIQGKNWWRAYFDHDDPTHWDITLNINYSGSLSLGSRGQSQDPDFLAWLRSYGITPGPQHVGMPLGQIIEGKHLVNRLGVNDHVIDVTIL